MLDAERVLEALENDELVGFCIECGEEHGELLESDARNVLCDSCGEHKVCGTGEILMLGLL